MGGNKIMIVRVDEKKGEAKYIVILEDNLSRKSRSSSNTLNIQPELQRHGFRPQVLVVGIV